MRWGSCPTILCNWTAPYRNDESFCLLVRKSCLFVLDSWRWFWKQCEIELFQDWVSPNLIKPGEIDKVVMMKISQFNWCKSYNRSKFFGLSRVDKPLEKDDSKQRSYILTQMIFSLPEVLVVSTRVEKSVDVSKFVKSFFEYWIATIGYNVPN